MRLFIALILALATLFPCLATAYDVLVLQSRRDPASEEVLKSYRARCAASSRVLVMSDYSEIDLPRILREERPRVILTLGDAALRAAVVGAGKTPVVSLLAVGLRQQAVAHPNVAGVDMYAAPEQYMELFKNLKSKRVGVVYNQGRSGWYVKLARQAAQKAGITLVTREVAGSSETLSKLSSLSGKVDALWMLPDTVAVTRETSEAYLRFGQGNAVPVVSFSSSYLGLGASAALDLNRAEMGNQASELVNNSLRGKPAPEMTVEFPHGVSIKTNPDVLKRLTSGNLINGNYAQM